MAVVASTLMACAEKSERKPPPEPAAVNATPTELVLRSGEPGQLSVEVNDRAGEPIGGAEIRFRSADPAVATVSDTGRVSPSGPVGRTSIRIMSGGRETEIPVHVTAGRPARIEKIAGDNQQTQVATPLPQPLVVRVTDAAGNPIGKARVRFATPEDEAPDEAVTDSDGRASVEFELGAVAGTGFIVADVPEHPEARSTFSVLALPGPPAALSPAESMSASDVAAGAEVDLAVRVADAHGNAVAGVEVQWSVAAGGGEAAPAASTTDESGTATTRLTTGVKAGSNQVIATAPSSAAPPLKLEVRAIAGAPAALRAVRGGSQTARAGSNVRVPPAFLVVDSHGNPVNDVAVQFAVSSVAGTELSATAAARASESRR